MDFSKITVSKVIYFIHTIADKYQNGDYSFTKISLVENRVEDALKVLHLLCWSGYTVEIKYEKSAIFIRPTEYYL